MDPKRPLIGSLPLLLAALSLGVAPPSAALPPVSDAAGHYAPPSAAEVARVKAAFRDAAARSQSDRSGQIFALPAKYNYIAEGAHMDPLIDHLNGKPMHIRGTAHGTSWEYDTHIPLVMWGPGVVKAGYRTETEVTQQNLAPTYANLIGTVPPEDATGRVLSEAFLPKHKHPKVILTVVFDQAGEVYYRAHPGATPNIDRLKREGTYFTNCQVSHVDTETGIGHSAIGTGAWPTSTGISSNNFWMRGFGGKRYSFEGGSPEFLESPTLGDVWLRASHNKALVAGYCYADRAAIGMAGHGSLYKGNKKPWVIFYDEKAGQLTTNTEYYELPDFLKGRSPASYYDALTKGTGVWLDHKLDPKDLVRDTPAYVDYDGDNMVSLIENEPFGQDDVTDLIYVTLKSTDACGHAFGHESDEAGAVLHEEDKQLGRIVDALVKKAGRDNVLVTLTADHGSTPLAELSHGVRVADSAVIEALNRKVDHLDNGVKVFDYVSATQLWVNDAERRRNHLTYAQLKQAVLDFKVNGKPFYIDAVTREEAEQHLAATRKF